MSPRSKGVLGAVFAVRLKGGRATASEVGRQLGVTGRSVKDEMGRLAGGGYLDEERQGWRLTSKGRRELKVVFIGGGFEVIHHGHLYTIEKAKGLGDVLVVSVARDSTIRKRKNREPVAGEAERVRMLSSLRQVDAAILGVEGDIYETLEKVGPDVVALGYDQYHMVEEVGREAKKRGLRVRVVRLDSPFPGVKTSALIAET